MKLAAYLRESGINQPAFARKLGITKMAVSRYCRGRRLPEYPIMLRIVNATGGLVTPNDFYGLCA